MRPNIDSKDWSLTSRPAIESRAVGISGARDRELPTGVEAPEVLAGLVGSGLCGSRCMRIATRVEVGGTLVAVFTINGEAVSGRNEINWY